MQPNLNKASSKIARFILRGKLDKTMGGISKTIFLKRIIKEFGSQCHDTFFHEGVPVIMNVEIRIQKNASNEIKNNKYLPHRPSVSELLTNISKALSGAAYHNEMQIVEVFVTKIFGNEDRLTVEMERAWSD
jgi:Holliday junction resolvase RusA-like endonuclease